MNEDELPTCPACDGYGYIIDIEVDVECCGWIDEDNNCCNKPIQIQKQVQKLCSYCYHGIIQ